MIYLSHEEIVRRANERVDELGLSQTEVAERVSAHRKEIGVNASASQPSVYRALSGQRSHRWLACDILDALTEGSVDRDEKGRPIERVRFS